MPRLLKCIWLIPVILAFFSSIVIAAEEITITTYYPSPYGVYKTLRLYPNDDAAAGGACTNPGEMSYDASANQVLVCNGSTNTWQGLGGASTPGESIMYLRSINTVAPATCPSGWLEADYQQEYMIDRDDRNYVRSCYRTDMICQVMYLRRYSVGGAPLSCPAGWSEADYKSEYASDDSSRVNNVRTCYICR